MSSTIPKGRKRKHNQNDKATIEKLIQQNKQQEAEIKRITRENNAASQQIQRITREKQQITREKQQITREKQKITREKDKVIAEKDALIQTFSLRTLLHIKSIKLNKDSTSKSNTNPPNKEAAVVNKEFTLYRLRQLENLPNKILDLPSSLMTSALVKETKSSDSKTFQVSYGNEAKVAHLTRLALDDAITVMEHTKQRKLCVHYERNMFSFRPDLCVVVDVERNTPILCIEVKAPHDSTFFTKKVMGQTFDYLSLMRLLGCGAPFAVATSISETYVCWLDQDSCNKIAKDERTKIIKKQQKQTEQPSSVIKTPDPPEFKKPENGGRILGSKFEKIRRKLMRSEKVSSNKLVAALCSALDCATHTKALNYPNTKIFDLTNDWEYNHHALALSENSYEWGNLKAKANETVDEFKIGGETVTHYLLDCVGQGATSNAYNAITCHGKHVVIKMFCKLSKSEADVALQNDQPKQQIYQSRSKYLKQAKAKCMEEVENAQKIYQEDNLFSWKMLGGMHCVEMPFFTPLNKGERSDRDVIKKIKKVLEKFRAVKLRYRQTDIQWRHIGKFGDEIVLFDLADLETMKKDDPNMVSNHIQSLKARTGRS